MPIPVSNSEALHVSWPALLADQGIPGWLIQAGLVFFFLVLPIIRGIRESIAKKRELEQARGNRPQLEPSQTESAAPEPTSADSALDMEDARRRFEALLRGEVPEPVVSRDPPSTASVNAPEARLAGRLTDMTPAPTEDEAESASNPETADPEHFIPDEEQRSREEIDRRIRDERASRTEFLRRERLSGAGRRTSVAADPMTSLGAPTAAAKIHRASRPDVLFPDGASAAVRMAAMRRAIVAAEVLGPPSALRDPAAGPVGLRRSP